jgi:hypothetical protein
LRFPLSFVRLKLPRVSPLPVLALLVNLAASARAAPTAEEQRLFTEGNKAFEAGDARGAERAFREGYGIAHDPAFLVRMAEAEEKAGAPAEAAETYRRYLREAPNASDRADIEQRIARLAPLAAPAAPAHDPDGPTHELGSGVAPTLPTAPAPRATAAVGDAETARPATDDGDSGWNRYNITAMSAAGVTAVLLGTAAFFGAQASSKEGDVNRLLGFRDETTGVPVVYSSVARQYDSAVADGRRDAHDARLALLGAAGAAAVAAVFFVIDGLRTGDAGVALAPVGSGATFAAAWRF